MDSSPRAWLNHRVRAIRSRRAPVGATESDVEACYRLLLGRAPDPGGLAYYRSALGHPVSDLVGAFLDSREFHLTPLYRRVVESAERTDQPTLSLIQLPGWVQFVDPSDGFVGQAISQQGTYEPHLTSAIRSTLVEGATFLDVGANIGWFSLLAASIVGTDGKVVAVEADPVNSQQLLSSCDANGFQNVVVLPVAASDRAQAVRLQRLGGSNAAVYQADTPSAPGDRIVSALPLDHLAGMFDRLDVMKVDVEGAELLVVKGAQGLITRHRPVIYLEFSPGMLLRFNESGTAELQSWMDDAHYEAAIVGFDGQTIKLADLGEARAYCEQHGHQHVDLQLTPR